MLLCNNLAGRKVIPEPIVSKRPCTKVVPEEDRDIFPACAVTRSITIGKPFVTLVIIIHGVTMSLILVLRIVHDKAR